MSLALYFPKSPKWLPFPAFGSSLKHQIVSPVQSQKALPLHSSCVPYTSAATLPQSKRCSGTDSSWWVSDLDPGAEAFLGQQWEGPDRVLSSLSPWLGFLPAVVPLCSSGLVKVGLRADGCFDEHGRVLFGLPLLPLSLYVPLWVCRQVFYHVT